MLGRGLNRDRQTRIVSAEEHVLSLMTVSKFHSIGAAVRHGLGPSKYLRGLHFPCRWLRSKIV